MQSRLWSVHLSRGMNLLLLPQLFEKGVQMSSVMGPLSTNKLPEFSQRPSTPLLLVWLRTCAASKVVRGLGNRQCLVLLQ